MEQINQFYLLKFLDPYEVTLDEFAQIKDVLFAHVYKPEATQTSKLCSK